MTATTDDDSAATRIRTADMTLQETPDGWRLTISASALARLAVLAGDDGQRTVRIPAGELTMELHPNLVPGTPFDVTDIEIAGEAGEAASS